MPITCVGHGVRREVVYDPGARDDLIALYTYIATRSGAARALNYVRRIEARCRGLAEFPEQGTLREDLRPGLRLLGFERRAVIAFHPTADTVRILRILHGGRDLHGALT